MEQEWVQQWGTILMVLAALIACIYIYFNASVREGLETAIDKKRETSGAKGSESTSIDNPTQYLDILKNDVNTMKHSLNITNNRTDYENIIIYLDDLMHYSMLKLVSTNKLNKDDPLPIVEKLNKYHQSIAALNELMSWLDKK